MNTVKQGTFPILSVAVPLDLLDEDLLAGCPTFAAALGVSRALGRCKWSDRDLSGELGLQQSVWSRIQNKPKDSPAYMPEDKVADLCGLLGNVGVIQWLAYRAGYRLVPMVESKKQRLQRELAELEAMERVA